MRQEFTGDRKRKNRKAKCSEMRIVGVFWKGIKESGEKKKRNVGMFKKNDSIIKSCSS